jgi:hypothetical protein
MIYHRYAFNILEGVLDNKSEHPMVRHEVFHTTFYIYIRNPQISNTLNNTVEPNISNTLISHNSLNEHSLTLEQAAEAIGALATPKSMSVLQHYTNDPVQEV